MRALSRHAALPADHGSWVFLLVPLVVGLVLGGSPGPASPWLVLAALAGFLIRQPLTLAARIVGGRRPASDRAAVALWGAIWGLAAVVGVIGLIVNDRAVLLALAAPALPLLLVQLQLVSRRAERRRPGLEVAGAAVLTLAAPAAFWCGSHAGPPGALRGWVLWLVLWFQAAASLLHVHALLVRRGRGDAAAAHARAIAAGTLTPPLAASLFWMVGLPAWIGLAAVPQAIENWLGPRRALTGVRPASVGLRQAALTILFALLLIGLWSAA